MIHLHDSGLELLKVGIPKMIADSEIATNRLPNSRITLCAKLECRSLFEFTLFPSIGETFNYGHCYLKNKTLELLF